MTQRSSALKFEQEMKAVDVGQTPDNRPFDLDLPKFQERDRSLLRPSAEKKLVALLCGYKTRRILNKHMIVSQLKADYSDLLKFAFGL